MPEENGKFWPLSVAYDSFRRLLSVAGNSLISHPISVYYDYFPVVVFFFFASLLQVFPPKGG